MTLFVVRLVALFLMLLGTFICGTLPIFCFRSKCFSNGGSSSDSANGGNKVTSFLIFLGGGVLMSTCFLHLLPESRESFSQPERNSSASVASLQKISPSGLSKAKNVNIPTDTTSTKEQTFNNQEKFALPEFIILCGFFATYLIEEVIHALFVHCHSNGSSIEIRARICSCAQRDTECSRTYKDVLPNKSLFAGGKNKLPQNPHLPSHVHVQPAPLLTPSLAAQHFPDYGSLKATGSVIHTGETPADNIPTVTDNTSKVEDVDPISISSLLTVAALSFHSVFEGFAIGFQPTIVSTWTLFLAVAVHKFVIAFVVGVEVMAEGGRAVLVLAYMSVFATMSPLGMAIAIFTGTTMQKMPSVVVGTLNCIATGTLLYVTFLEILQRKGKGGISGLSRFAATTAGAGLMALLQYLTTEI